MIRHIRVLGIFLALSVVPAPFVQADIFVGAKKDSQTNETDKPTVYIKKPSQNGTQKDDSDRDFYISKTVDTTGLIQHTQDEMKLASYWQKTGREPQTMDERLLYASAMRADDRMLIAKRRKALFAYLIKEQEKAEIRVEEGWKAADLRPSRPSALAKSASAGTNNASEKKKKTIYVTKKDNTPAKPKRVFTDFR
ncbi:MAG: hypothetical protein R3D66_02595 [Alphaproteobacteria bacterium]